MLYLYVHLANSHCEQSSFTGTDKHTPKKFSWLGLGPPDTLVYQKKIKKKLFSGCGKWDLFVWPSNLISRLFFKIVCQVCMSPMSQLILSLYLILKRLLLVQPPACFYFDLTDPFRLVNYRAVINSVFRLWIFINRRNRYNEEQRHN